MFRRDSSANGPRAGAVIEFYSSRQWQWLLLRAINQVSESQSELLRICTQPRPPNFSTLNARGDRLVTEADARASSQEDVPGDEFGHQEMEKISRSVLRSHSAAVGTHWNSLPAHNCNHLQFRSLELALRGAIFSTDVDSGLRTFSRQLAPNYLNIFGKTLIFRLR